MIPIDRRKQLIEEAKRLSSQLGSFRTPGNNDPVDPSRLAELRRYLDASRNVVETITFLERLPSSFHARVTRSAEPQLREVLRLVKPLLERHRGADPDEMLFVLGWTERLLRTEERGTGLGHARGPANAGHRGGGGPSRGSHGGRR